MVRLSLSIILLLGLIGSSPSHRTISDLYQPGDERGWIFKSDGERIGDHWFRYDGPAEFAGRSGVHRFSSRTRLSSDTGVGIIEQLYASELLTREDGRPIYHRLTAKIGDNTQSAELTFVQDNKAEAVIVQGQSKRKLTVDAPGDAYIQANNFIGYFDLLLGLSPPGEGSPINVTLFSGNSLQALPYQARWIQDSSTDEGGIVLKDSLGETIHLGKDGHLQKIEVTAQKLVIMQTKDVLEPFTIEAKEVIAPSPDFLYEDVVVQHGNVSLAGSLTRLKESQGKLPAVFFISGSGLQDRHGYSSGIDTGTHEILDAVTRAGFAVLRVDDRGAGDSKGPTSGMSYDDLVEDARACLQFLFKHKDVDPTKVSLIGHSEGGVTAPILAAEEPRILAIALMASTGRPLADVMMDQNDAALENSGVTGEEKKKQLAQIRAIFDRIATDEVIEPESVPKDLRQVLQMLPWLRSHARQDPSKNITKVTCPILILQGGKDFQVSPEKDAKPLVEALSAAGHPNYEMQLFPELDHLFKKAPGKKSQFADYLTDRPIDSGFLFVLTAWLKKQAKK